jgi:hypothetical protein
MIFEPNDNIMANKPTAESPLSKGQCIAIFDFESEKLTFKKGHIYLYEQKSKEDIEYVKVIHQYSPAKYCEFTLMEFYTYFKIYKTHK